MRVSERLNLFLEKLNNACAKKVYSSSKFGVFSSLFLKSNRDELDETPDYTEHLSEYVGTDVFAESGAYEDFVIDKLLEQGFSNEEIEFGWDDPKVKKARDIIDRRIDDEDYVTNWAKDYIFSDKYRYMQYQEWLRDLGYPSYFDEPLMKRYSFDPANNTFPGTH